MYLYVNEILKEPSINEPNTWPVTLALLSSSFFNEVIGSVDFTRLAVSSGVSDPVRWKSRSLNQNT